MNKITLIVAVMVCALMLLNPQITHASENVAGSSAVLRGNQNEAEETVHVLAIKNVLSRYNSPMIQEAENFVIVSNALDLDPYLLPAIAGVESGFGNALIHGSNNPFGWNVGRTLFPTWSDGIATVGYALRHKYINKGAESLNDIGYRYAGGSTTWAPKVLGYIQAFEREEAKIRRYSML
jgi:hypothetical protein